MKYRPSRSFVICLVVMVALAGGGAWAWHKVDGLPVGVRAKTGFFEALTYCPPVPRRQPTPAEVAELRQRGRVLLDKLVGEFPVLKITPAPVPAEDNGFLRLHRLAGPPHSETPKLDPKFSQLLSGATPWDPALARRCLDEHAGLVNQIEQIAALPTRSSSGMPDDYNGFVSGRTGKNASEILLLKARLAAEAHDETETLRLVAAVGNLADHYQRIESPTLICETIAILIDRGLWRAVLETLLPALGNTADLVRWRELLGRRSYSARELAGVLRGEWNTGNEFMLLPVIFVNVTDEEAVARVYAAWFAARVTTLATSNLADLATFDCAAPDGSNLSKPGQKILNDFTIGLAAWGRGYARTALAHGQVLAALELLALEQAGTQLVAESAVQVVRDPVSGEPYAFDPVLRVVRAPKGGVGEFEQLKLPW